MKTRQKKTVISNHSSGFFLTLASTVSLLLGTSATQALEHRDLMWGVKNSGASITTGKPIPGKLITVDVDPLQTYRIQSVEGEDLNLLPSVKARKKVKVAVIDTGIDTTHPDLKNFIYRNATKCEAYKNLLLCMDDAALKDQENTNNQRRLKRKNEKDKKNGDQDQLVAEKPLVLQCRDKNLQAEKNVYPADCLGWSVLDAGFSFGGNAQMTPNHIIGRPDFDDKAGHGTHVAGAILAVTENIELIPVQVIGHGPNQPLKPFAVDLSPSEEARGGGLNSAMDLSERVARGIIYAINAGAEVINLSMGWPGAPEQNSEIIREAILEAQRRNIIVVAAAGNDSTDAILRPCQYKNVICVAASRPDGALASFSNFGMGVDIAAPGVEILSTIPMKLSSVRLPGYKGYDYLSGTSQATPYVSGVIAEMLARGVPVQEIYPRLILGARPVRDELPVLRGPVNSPGVPVDAKTAYKKTVLSGNIDMRNSMQVQPQPLILPADKETAIIEWDRKSANLNFNFKLKNYWEELKGKKVSVQLRSSVISEIEPAIISANLVGGSASSWKTHEEKTVQVKLQIRDNPNPALSRIQRELSYEAYVMIDGKTHRKFEVKAEVIAPISKTFIDPDVTTIPFVGSVPQGQSLSPVDEVYDNDQMTRDYFLFGRDDNDKSSFNIALVKMNQGRYEVMPYQNIKFDGNITMWRPRYKIRMDIDGDGQSEYVFGVIEYLDAEKGLYGPYRNHFFIFDRDMRLKKTYLFDDQRMTIPYFFFWMKVGNSMRPAWVAKGPEIKKNWDITDLWSVDSYENVPTQMDIRLFYANEDFKLAHADQDPSQRIVDVIQPTITQVKQGVLPVLLAKNVGTELKPSYINQFAIGEMQNAKLVRQRPLTQFNSEMTYRNLVDSMNDKALSINTSATEFKGSMWYGLDAHKRQRVTLLDLDQSKIFDKLVNSQREVFDAALQIRAGFQSEDRRGVFLITNSEIEYHELNSNQVATRSLNRFSFYGDGLIELYNPITILDRTSPNKKLPGLYTTEGTGLAFGMKIMVPVYNSKGISQKVVTPARLSFKAAQGCKALPQPLFLGEGSGYALDYYCGDQIKRVLLKY